MNATNADGLSNKAKLAEGLASLQPNYGMGYGSDSDSQSSVTKSGINTENITIKDEKMQLERTGKTDRETIAAIKTDITTDNAEMQSGKLANNFDKDKVQKELDLQREVTESFGHTVTDAGAMIADKLSEEVRKKKYEAAGIAGGTLANNAEGALSQQIAIDSAYTLYDLGNDTEKSTSQKESEVLGKGLGISTSIGSDKLLSNKGINSVVRQIVSEVSGAYVENKVKSSSSTDKKEEKK